MTEFEQLKARLGACGNEAAVRECLEESLLSLLDGTRARVFVAAEFERMREKAPFNPVLGAFLREEVAMHEAQVVDSATWRRLCPRADHGHVLVGPLLQGGELFGVMAVTREQGLPLFGSAETRMMSRISLYASARLCELGRDHHLPAWETLTPREKEVAERAGRGLRNQEIAQALSLSEHTVKQNLKAVFRKLGLRSRTELAMRRARAVRSN